MGREHLPHVTRYPPFGARPTCLTVAAAGRPGIVPGTRIRSGCSCPADDEGAASGAYGPDMPLYQCISPSGLLDDATREKLAEEITRIHCDATGIPPSFVNVLFLDVPAGRSFVAGKP